MAKWSSGSSPTSWRRIFQHEDDHLRGIVFLERLESTRDVVTEKEYQKQFSRPAPVNAAPASRA